VPKKPTPSEPRAPEQVVLPRLPAASEVDYSKLSEDDRKLLENLALYDSDDEELDEENEDESDSSGSFEASADSDSEMEDVKPKKKVSFAVQDRVVEKNELRNEPDYDHDLHLKEVIISA
jgi:hypothetical protein